MFRLDPAFLAASEALTDLTLCAVRLQNDGRFPWLILIPRAPGATELESLDAGERSLLLDEVIRAGRAVRDVGAALGKPVEKLNIGQLGNITRQLHVHVVGRRTDDPCWPGPVWGQGHPKAYRDENLAIAVAAALTSLRAA